MLYIARQYNTFIEVEIIDRITRRSYFHNVSKAAFADYLTQNRIKGMEVMFWNMTVDGYILKTADCGKKFLIAVE